MFKKLDFNFVIIAYILLMAVIILGTTTKEQVKPTQVLIKKYDAVEDMQHQSEQLFKKGWQIKDLESYQYFNQSTSNFIVIYER